MCWLRMWSDRCGSGQSGIFLYPLACGLSVLTAGVPGIAKTSLCMLCHWCIWLLKDSNWETLAVEAASLLALLLFLHNWYEISCCQNVIDHIYLFILGSILDNRRAKWNLWAKRPLTYQRTPVSSFDTLQELPNGRLFFSVLFVIPKDWTESQDFI